MCVPSGTFVRCVVVKGMVGEASPGAFRWGMTIEVRFTSKTRCFITSFNEVRTITCMIRSRVIRFIILTEVNL